MTENMRNTLLHRSKFTGGEFCEYFITWKVQQIPASALRDVPSTISKDANVYEKIVNLCRKSETLRRIISNLWAAFRDFLELKIIFPINYASTDVVGAYIIYRKYYFEF